MKLKLNGKEKDLDLDLQKAWLSSTIDILGYKPNTIIVEVNNIIISSNKWDEKLLKEGDRLEIVSIVGGG